MRRGDRQSGSRGHPPTLGGLAQQCLELDEELLVWVEVGRIGRVSDLRNALVRPPRGFAGPMDVAVELRLADDRAVDRKVLRLEWSAPPVQAKGFPTRQLDQEEVADLMKRGEAFIAVGDLAAARLVLQRAAEGGDPRATMTLAGTYDPIVLEKRGVQGLASDIALARKWYERAKELGSPEALRRLEMPASRDR